MKNKVLVAASAAMALAAGAVPASAYVWNGTCNPANQSGGCVSGGGYHTYEESRALKNDHVKVSSICAWMYQYNASTDHNDFIGGGCASDAYIKRSCFGDTTASRYAGYNGSGPWALDMRAATHSDAVC